LGLTVGQNEYSTLSEKNSWKMLNNISKTTNKEYSRPFTERSRVFTRKSGYQRLKGAWMRIVLEIHLMYEYSICMIEGCKILKKSDAMQGKYSFIKLQKVILRNFSLYKKDGKVYEVNEEINEGVYCLAGANGLGKTTFLNSINFGLTGIVLEPNKEVLSPGEIVESNKTYTERYFLGRINKKDEKKAEIEIFFKINEKIFRIIRNFFEREELRLLEVFSTLGDKKISHFTNRNESPRELNKHYQKLLADEIGFTSFDYFVFYQLYIFTFDENRRMIFWDDRASSHALAIAFNSAPDYTERILNFTREIERHESNARNLKWQSTQAKKKIEELINKTKGQKTPDTEKLENEYDKLHKDLEKIERTFGNIKIEYDTMLKKQSHLNSEIMQLRNEHRKLFSRYSQPYSKLLGNSNIQYSMKNQKCCLCSAAGSNIVENIEKNIHKEMCPLCNTTINDSSNVLQDSLFTLIQENDLKICTKNTELENIISEIDGKKFELDNAEIELNKVKEIVKEFTEDNPNISFKGTGNKNIDTLIEQYRKQCDLASKEAQDEYAERNKLKPEYEKLLKRVEVSYKEAETIFVPIFKRLAKSFIGLDLNIQPKRNDKTIKLVLELKDTARTESFQLSESQRFFLDIALRMSLAIFLSDNKNGATMMVDTPEGSLDIAYESRVGNMFAEYATIYNQNLFMTANINASQLLLSLAEKCGENKMKFRRMLEWTDLSEIQKEGEYLFKKVYENIEIALNKKNNQ
jgi:DNA repair exonuclease SbcCD ATPase subunit